jgi:NTE family protein
MGWSDEEMLVRYRRSFVDTNPVNDYTFPLVALTRGRKVSRLLEREYGDVCIEDLRLPYFCISANLTTGRALEHRQGALSRALRASVAIPGVMPPVFDGEEVLVDGAAINNLPVDFMLRHAPGHVIGCDAGADRSFSAELAAGEVRRCGDSSRAAATGGDASIFFRFSCMPGWRAAPRARRRKSPIPSSSRRSRVSGC